MCWPGTGYEPIYCPPNGTPQVLPMPPGASAQGAKANAVNNSGVVVGHMYAGSSGQWFQGVVWMPDGSVQVIAPLPGFMDSKANDINDAGVIVGYSGGIPYVIDDGVMTTIPNGGLGGGFASRIADSGQVTGTLGNENVNARAFLWHEEALTLLEPISGYPVSVSRDVNSSGVVVGYSRTAPSPTVQRPTLWIDGQAIELTMPPDCTTGAAVNINDAGVITGECGGPGIPAVQVIWVDGAPYPINSLLLPGTPSIGTMAAINGMGQILSSGGPKLATPIRSSIADLDGDCAVDGDDLGVLLASWGAPDFDPRCDFNGDGVVNGDDLGTLLGEWTASK